MNQAPAQRLRVVVADAQAAVREGLVTLLGLLVDVEVVGAAGDGEQALALVDQHAPDVVLMVMPRLDGIEATTRLRAAHPGTQVVVLTTYADDTSILQALHAGAAGLPDQGRRPRADRPRPARRRGRQVVLDPAVHARLLAASRPDRTTAPAPASPAPAARLPDGLTPREAEVPGHLAAGLTNTQIAAAQDRRQRPRPSCHLRLPPRPHHFLTHL